MVAAGTYTATVTDAVGCTSTVSYTITQPTAITISFSIIPITCTNASNGSITASVTGGASPYTFHWDYPAPLRLAVDKATKKTKQKSVESIAASFLIDNTISGLSAGIYTLTVTDSNGCVVAAACTLANPPNPCNVVLNLKLFIQGFYRSPGLMVAVVDPVNTPTLTDTIRVELHQSQTPFALQYQQNALLDTSGNCTVIFPAAIWMNNYYVVLKHRNALETWSKLPITFGATNFYDFTEADVPMPGLFLK